MTLQAHLSLLPNRNPKKIKCLARLSRSRSLSFKSQTQLVPDA